MQLHIVYASKTRLKQGNSGYNIPNSSFPITEQMAANKCLL